jgi:hypothetical protein
MKQIILLLALLSMFTYSFGQNKISFQSVNLPDSVLISVRNFLSQKENTTITGAILTYNLIDKNKSKYEDGIYSFKILGPHFRRNIFIVSDKHIHIFKGYFIDELLTEFYQFIKQNKLSDKIKIDYLKAISLFLEQEYISENF